MPTKKRIAYLINPADYGEKTISPILVRENESGYCKTDFNWKISKNFTIEDAKMWCTAKNRDMKLTQEDVITIVASSMREFKNEI